MTDDMISRQAALDALGEEPPVWYDGEEELAERYQWRRDVAAIKALPSAQRWIPTSERLPEKSGEYLVTVKWWKGKFITFVEYDADYKEWIDEKACCWTVTAWRPKPIPWEGGQDGKD